MKKNAIVLFVYWVATLTCLGQSINPPNLTFSVNSAGNVSVSVVLDLSG